VQRQCLQRTEAIMREQAEPVATWLLRCGFRDQAVAEAAGQRLDIRQLQPLWHKLQQKLSSEASRRQISQPTGRLSSNTSSGSDRFDPEFRQQQVKLSRLTDSVLKSKQQLLQAQVMA